MGENKKLTLTNYEKETNCIIFLIKGWRDGLVIMNNGYS